MSMHVPVKTDVAHEQILLVRWHREEREPDGHHLDERDLIEQTDRQVCGDPRPGTCSDGTSDGAQDGDHSLGG